MEGNKDESERCISIAKSYLLKNENQKALKFFHKSQKLYPSAYAQDMINKLEELINENSENNQDSKLSQESESNLEDKENRFENDSKKRSKENYSQANGASNSNANLGEYTSEQIEAVKKIRKCKDYYEILGVTKDSTKTEIKKQYRKLALQFHPDKNKAPGAAEAFKAISNSFLVLIDDEKRKKYDMYGSEEEQRERNSRSNLYSEDGFYYDYSRGFDGDMSAEEIFNLFFGGGNVYVRRTNRWRETRTESSSNQEMSGYSVFLQIMPILVLLCLSLMSSLFISDPPYSLHRTQKYYQTRVTSILNVQYYVKESFESDNNKASIKRIENMVEEDYLNNLRAACFREKNHKESMFWRARTFGDRDLEKKAKAFSTSSCSKFQELQSQYYRYA